MKTRLFLILALAAVATLAPLTGCGGGTGTHYVHVEPLHQIHVENDYHGIEETPTPTPTPTPPAP